MLFQRLVFLVKDVGSQIFPVFQGGLEVAFNKLANVYCLAIHQGIVHDGLTKC
jgi:hypothetical protein